MSFPLHFLAFPSLFLSSLTKLQFGGAWSVYICR